MKVLVINALYHPHIIGGAERSVQVLVENLHRFDIQAVVATLSDQEKVGYVHGIKVYYLNHGNVYWSYYAKQKKSYLKVFWHLVSLYNFRIQKKLNRILAAEKPDVVHTNNLAEFSVSIWRFFHKKKIPVVHTLRDYALLCPRVTLFRRGDVCQKKNWLCRCILSFRRRYSKYVDVAVGNSHFILKEHTRSGFFPNAQKQVIYNALPGGDIRSGKKPKGPLRFGFMGLLSQHKGIEWLLEAFQGKDLGQLHVFGKGINQAYEQDLKKQYKAENIIFCGYKKPDQAFARIDMLVVPSLWHDPLPRVIYEAYAYGVPVLGSARGGIAEIIEPGKTGYVLDPGQPEQLVQTIRQLQKDPEAVRSMAGHCIRKARDFLPENALQKYAEVFRSRQT